jgi:hypothetical protein
MLEHVLATGAHSVLLTHADDRGGVQCPGRSILTANYCWVSNWKTSTLSRTPKVPGIAFADWDPGDMARSLGVVG